MRDDPHGPTPVRLTDPRIVVLLAALVLTAIGLMMGWKVLDGRTPHSGGALLLLEDREAELPDDIPDLPAELTYDDRADMVPSMVQLPPAEADELIALFDLLGFAWPPDVVVPAIAVQQLPAGLDDMEVEQRKALFFRSLLPLILAENLLMLETRYRLQEILSRGALEQDSSEYRALATLGERFRVSGEPNDAAFRALLLKRIDAVPADMALAQAANESGWGTSRFTREGNNLFGVWTWEADQGLIPEDRPEDADHRVRIFPDLRASVRNFVYTINVGNAYRDLRELRREMRENGDRLTGVALAAELTAYSERGEAYVAEIQNMIMHNGLDQLPELELIPVDAEAILDAVDAH